MSIRPAYATLALMTGRIKKLLISLALPFLLVAGYLGWRFLSSSEAAKAALSLNLSGAPQEVWLGGEVVGTTPFFSRTLAAGNWEIRVASWSARLALTPGTLTAVNLDLGPNTFLTKEEVFWLEESEETRIAITTSPEGAEVRLDGQSYGISPLSLPISAGAYELLVSKEGYEEAALKVQVQPGYKLNAWLKLRGRPVPEELTPLAPEAWGWTGDPEALTLVDLSSADPQLTGNTALWAEGAALWFSQHPESDGVDYFLDSSGRFLDGEGQVVQVEPAPRKLRFGYLGTVGEGGVSEEAKAALLGFLGAGGQGVAAAMVEILPTGTGFLRVRSGSGTAHAEITRVHPGEKYPLLEEVSGWYKIRLVDQTEGWISGRYAKKL